MMSNKRDCEHGSQIGKCYICDLVEAENRIAELESTVDYMERTHNKIVGAILDLDEMEQDSEEMANAEQDLLELAKSSKVYGVPSEYRDMSGAKRIAELEKNNTDLQECFDTCYAELEATRDAHDELQINRTQSQWISVDDRLPDDDLNEEVIFYIDELDQIEIGKYKHSTKLWILPHRTTVYPIGMITHWANLPLPPKEQGQ